MAVKYSLFLNNFHEMEPSFCIAKTQMSGLSALILENPGLFNSHKVNNGPNP